MFACLNKLSWWNHPLEGSKFGGGVLKQADPFCQSSLEE